MRRVDIAGQAFRNVRRQKTRSILTIFAIMIGATSVTIMLALVTGAKNFFLSQFESTGQLQHVAVTQATDLSYDQASHSGGPTQSTGTPLTDALATRIRTFPHVTGLAKTVDFPFDALSYGGQKLIVQQMQAYEPNGVITQTMLAGRQLQPSDDAGVVLLSRAYADKLGFSGNYAGLIGQSVTLQSQPGYTGVGATITQPPQCAPQPQQQQGGGCNFRPQPPGPTLLSATVVGVTGGDSDQPVIRLSLAWATAMLTSRNYMPVQQQPTQCSPPPPQRGSPPAPPCQPPPQQFQLCSYPPFGAPITGGAACATNGAGQQQPGSASYSSFVASVDQATNADGVAAQIRTLGVGAVSAQSFVDQQLHVFDIVSLVFAGIGGIALLVAAIGVVNTMVMAILERTREIGVLRACGATRRTIRRLFTTEAAVLGFLGGCLGVAGGYGLTFVANNVVNQQLTKNSIAANNVITVPLWLVVTVIAVTTAIGTLAGLFPAVRAARLDPVDALRYE